MTKDELLYNLIKKKAFWSYNTLTSKFDDSIIIENCLLWGDVEELIALFKLFDFETIKKIWVEKLVPMDIFYKNNYYLGKIFFDIEDIREFIEFNSKKYGRLERIKQLSSEL